MHKYLTFSILLLIALIVGIFSGLVIYNYKIFPYGYIKEAYYYAKKGTYGPWSIGIYEGSTPLKLSDSKEISNPVLTGKDVDDIDATFVADPFMLFTNEKYYMFFEVMNRKTAQGDIGYAESLDGKNWEYKKIIIDEKFHLSYPYIFEWENNYYLIPESGEDFSVRLYKAISFPDKWEYVDDLLYGYKYADPTIFRYKDKWWLYTSNTDNSVLNLYYSENLFTGWQAHPMNPIVKRDKNISRPGGRVIVYKDKLYRYTQDCDPSYGNQIYAFEIIELTENTYREKIVSQNPVITKTGQVCTT